MLVAQNLARGTRNSASVQFRGRSFAAANRPDHHCDLYESVAGLLLDQRPSTVVNTVARAGPQHDAGGTRPSQPDIGVRCIARRFGAAVRPEVLGRSVCGAGHRIGDGVWQTGPRGLCAGAGHTGRLTDGQDSEANRRLSRQYDDHGGRGYADGRGQSADTEEVEGVRRADDARARQCVRDLCKFPLGTVASATERRSGNR